MATRRTVRTDIAGAPGSALGSGQHCERFRQERLYTLLLARDLQILKQDKWATLDELHRNAGGMTWLLYKSLLGKKATADGSQ